MKEVNIKDTTPMCGIYLIKYPNQKVYIGQAINIHSRILEHNSRARNIKKNIKRPVQICDKAIEKYFPDVGIQNYYVLEECSVEELDEKENYWINKYDAINKGYNYLDKGDVSGRRGINNVNASLNQEQFDNIVNALINNQELSCVDIAKKFNASINVVRNINWGISYINTNLKYPLRKENHNFGYKDNVLDYFENEQQLLNLKEDLKYSWWLSIEKDLIKKYNIPLRILHEINNGKKFENIGNYKYPIRKKNIRNTHNLTKKDVLDILNELRNTTTSMTEIGKKYGFYRNSISQINKGISYIIKDYDYPARLTK